MFSSCFKNICWVFSIFVLSSCSDWLIIEPAGKVTVDNYWKSASEVESVVASCYREMLDDDYMKRIIVWGELRSDNIIEGNGIGNSENQILQANIQPNNDDVKWAKFYRVINYCNTVLYYAPKVTQIDPNFTTSQMLAKKAEVLTIRALTYFYLVRTFKNVPYVTQPTLNDESDYKVYQLPENQIIDSLKSDLLKAEGWAMKAYSNETYNKGRITKNAVRALLADIYLWNNEYENCINYCDKVLNDDAYKPATYFQLYQNDENPYQMIFGIKNSKESIFELQFDESYQVNNFVFNFYGTLTKQGNFSVPKFIATGTTIYGANDMRKKDNFIVTSADQTSSFPIFKYTGSYRTENLAGISSYIYRSATANWIIYRLTDLMLMKAEALVQLDRDETDLKNAFSIVNLVYKRSSSLTNDSLYYSAYSSKIQMDELVLLERQRELMFEGKRWFDLVRMARRDGNTARLVQKVLLKYTENQTTIKSKMSDMNAIYLPIHQDEMKANPNLVQNPFYDNSLSIIY